MTNETDSRTIDDSRRRMERLIQRFFDQELDANESRELHEIWESSPELLDEACEHHRLETLLESIACRKNLFSRHEQNILPERFLAETSLLASLKISTMVSAQKLPDAEVRKAVDTTPTYRTKRKPDKKTDEKSIAIHPGVIGFVCVMLLALVFVWNFETDPESVLYENKNAYKNFHPFARIEAMSDIRWPDEAERLKVGQHLESKRIRFDNGIMELELKNGVRVALQGPIDFQLTSEMKTFCNTGRVSVTVPKSGKGFEVATPLLNVIDLGTEFSLDVQKDSVETHTITGRTRLSRLPVADVPLVEGNAFQLSTEGKSRRFEADPKTFLSKHDVARKVLEHDREKLSRWENFVQKWNGDPALLLHFDFEQSGRSITNVVSRHGAAASTGRLFGSRASVGRWKEKKALAFFNKRDYIETNVSRPLRSVTLFASVRIDRLDRYGQVILASRDDGPGSLIWQLGRGGTILLSIQSETGNAHIFSSQNILDRPQWGVWFQLATVVDTENNIVAHYIDGREIQRFPIWGDMTIDIGDATVGNGFWKVKTRSDRSLDGCMDQLMIFDRALSADEIHELVNSE